MQGTDRLSSGVRQRGLIDHVGSSDAPVEARSLTSPLPAIDPTVYQVRGWIDAFGTRSQERPAPRRGGRYHRESRACAIRRHELARCLMTSEASIHLRFRPRLASLDATPRPSAPFDASPREEATADGARGGGGNCGNGQLSRRGEPGRQHPGRQHHSSQSQGSPTGPIATGSAPRPDGLDPALVQDGGDDVAWPRCFKSGAKDVRRGYSDGSGTRRAD